jgi:hypothetical protein
MTECLGDDGDTRTCYSGPSNSLHGSVKYAFRRPPRSLKIVGRHLKRYIRCQIVSWIEVRVVDLIEGQLAERREVSVAQWN